MKQLSLYGSRTARKPARQSRMEVGKSIYCRHQYVIGGEVLTKPALPSMQIYIHPHNIQTTTLPSINRSLAHLPNPRSSNHYLKYPFDSLRPFQILKPSLPPLDNKKTNKPKNRNLRENIKRQTHLPSLKNLIPRSLFPARWEGWIGIRSGIKTRTGIRIRI